MCFYLLQTYQCDPTHHTKGTWTRCEAAAKRRRDCVGDTAHIEPHLRPTTATWWRDRELRTSCRLSNEPGLEYCCSGYCCARDVAFEFDLSISEAEGVVAGSRENAGARLYFDKVHGGCVARQEADRDRKWLNKRIEMLRVAEKLDVEKPTGLTNALVRRKLDLIIEVETSRLRGRGRALSVPQVGRGTEDVSVTVDSEQRSPAKGVFRPARTAQEDTAVQRKGELGPRGRRTERQNVQQPSDLRRSYSVADLQTPNSHPPGRRRRFGDPVRPLVTSISVSSVAKGHDGEQKPTVENTISSAPLRSVDRSEIMSSDSQIERLDVRTDPSFGRGGRIADRAAIDTSVLLDDTDHHVQQGASEILEDDRVEYEVENARMEDGGERKE